MTPPSLGTMFPPHAVPRKLRRTWWSLCRRVSPRATVDLPFTGGMKVAIPRYDRLARRIYLDGCSDYEQAAVLAACLKPGGVYFDVGAHVGQFALLGAYLVGASGQSHAFEATPATFEFLKRNAQINTLPQLTINHLAVFSEAGEVTIQVCDPADAAFNSISTPLRPDGSVVDTVQVPAVALAGYCVEHQIEKVDLIKIDVNGPELQVIRGAGSLLEGPDAPVLYVEFNDNTTAPLDYTTAQMRDEIEGLGYELFTFDTETARIVPEPRREHYEETVNLVATKRPEEINDG
ncbi:MAG: FkbM family methyltransferase [Planctomycetota bacterium]